MIVSTPCRNVCSRGNKCLYTLIYSVMVATIWIGNGINDDTILVIAMAIVVAIGSDDKFTRPLFLLLQTTTITIATYEFAIASADKPTDKHTDGPISRMQVVVAMRFVVVMQ